ncbi:MAG: hypothetical protein GTO63_16070, partial [Anaerolineae bacterium]|nr:hypothetical protein [Anaerolineae bacterium]NIN96190.1 hypothetical protein [Anaerolineae bacterium]
MRDPVSRLGYHYFPDDRHFAASDLETWLPVLQSLSAKWITLQASPKRAVPEPFLRGLLDAGVEPIIHIPCQVDSLRLPDLSPMLASYGRWGVRYVVVFDRPNMKSSWNPSEWSRADLIERFLDQMSPVLHAQKEAGLRPTLPPLEPGGDYWDTAFLEGSLEGLVRRSAAVRPEDLTLALYAWTYGKPLNWGAGGQARWPEARPYRTPPKSQDQFGLHIFDWYAAVAQDTVGQVLPMLVIAGGALPEHAGGL